MKKIILILTIILVTGTSVLAQAPVINSFTPDTGLVASSVSISGAFFDPIPANNQVFFGSAEATVLTASFSTLTVAVPAGTTTNLISVRNTSTNLIGYSDNHFNGVFCDTPLDASTYAPFSPSTNGDLELAGIYGAYNIDIYDMDGDGKSDIITGLSGITVARNISTVGTMNFVATNINTSASVHQFFIADFDGDGKRDIIISGNNGAYLFPNLSTPGNISFGTRITVGPAYGYYQCAAGDIDNDGRIDFVGGQGNNIRTFRNTSSGPGNFSFTEKTLVNVGSRANGIQVVDIDGDGKSDIVGTQRSVDRIFALRNTTSSATFSFANTQFFSTIDRGPYRLKIGDFDKDGKIDLVMPLYEGAKTCIFRNTSTVGAINFQTPIRLAASANNYRVGVGDVNGDGFPDIVTKPNGIGPIFQVYENTSSGAGNVSFNGAITYNSSGAAEVGGIAIGDMDGDLVPDIATSGISSNTIRFHRNTSAQVDNDAPTALCKNIIVALDPNGTVTITPQMLDNGSSDACGVGSFKINSAGSTGLQDSLNFTCAQIGDNTVTLTVFDFSGNSSTCEAIVNIAPAAIIVAGQTTVCQGDTVLLTANLGDSYQWQKDGIDISGATAQTYTADETGGYTVSVTNAGGCSGTSVSTEVTISEVTQATTTLSDSPDLCQGNTLTITASEGSAYVWSTGENSQSITVDTAGNYSVTVYDENGCTSVSEPVVVTVTPLPVASVTASGATTFCSGDNVTLTANEATSYLWSTLETTQSIEVTQSGNYSVKVYNAEGCFETSSGTEVIVNQTPSVTTSEAVTICDTPAVLTAVGNSNGAPIDPTFTQYELFNARGGTFTNNLCNDNYQWFGNASFSNNITETNISGLNFKLYYTCNTVMFTFKINGNQLGTFSNSGYQCTCNASSYGTYPSTVTFTEAEVAALWSAGSNVVTVEVNSPNVALAGIVAEVLSPGETYSWSPATGLSDANSATPEALPTETTTYTVTYATGNGCSVTSDVVVTVQCNEPPVAVCQVVEVSANANCEGTAVAADFDGGSSDPDGDEITYSVSPEGPYALGVTDVTLMVSDPSGETSTCMTTITVTDDEAPAITCPTPEASYTADPGLCSASLTFDATTSDNCGVASTVYSVEGVEISFPFAFKVGTTAVEVLVTDNSDNTNTCSFEVIVTDDEAPIIVDCPSNISQGNDAGVCEAVVTWTEPTASDNCTDAMDLVWTKSHEPEYVFPVGKTTVTYTATDLASNVSMTCSFDVTIINVVPYNDPETEGIIASSIDPIQAGTGFDLSADFNDDNLTSATWYFSDDGAINSPVDAEYTFAGDISGGVVSGAFNFNAEETGVYAVKVVVVDACGETAEATYDYVVIYDPSGGFVTGGGWFDSPDGAYVGTDLTGKANFGFVAKYRNGNNVVNGNTNFQFKKGDFHFKSSEYDDMSLVISGGKKATFRGTGTVNGSGSHKFLVTVIDGDAQGGDGDDKFRIRVWADGSSSTIMYDNEINAAQNADSTTILGGGSIVIHKPNGNNSRGTDAEFEPLDESVVEDFKVKAWPMPAKDRFNLKVMTMNTTDKVEVTVVDISNKLIHIDSFDWNQSYQFGEKLSAGVYFVRIAQGANIKIIRVVKR